MGFMKNINVGFYSPSVDQNKSNRLKYKDLMVNPTPYYLHGYFRKHYPEYAQYIKWKPSLLVKISTEEIVDFLVKHDVDVLCVSVYIWNVDQAMTVLKVVKDLYNKPLKIIIGGPSCDAVKDEWENKYPWVDHFVVGQGEKAWANLALDLLGVKVLDSSAANIVHILKKGEVAPVKEYEYEFVRGIHYSPFMECEDLIQELQVEYEEYGLAWPYETQRGCPYHCSFCDWNGGQSNKTQKRKEISFIDEIDFMAKNKMYNLHISDANFGMWDVDVEIMKRMVEHKKNGHNFNFVSFNMSKIINNNFKEIMHLIVEHDFNSVWLKLSVQDIHQSVLEAIDRPGDWNESKKVGLELYEKFSESKNLKKIFVELILGLPGQSVESFTATLDEFYSNGFIPRTYPFLLLRNAPATYNMEYRAKHGIKDDLVYETIDMSIDGNTIKEVHERPLTNFIYHQIVQCNTFTEKDFVKMSMIDQLYRRLLSRKTWAAYGFIDVNWSYLKPILVKLTETEDFNYVLEQRYLNFKNYRINAMDSAEGNILVDGNDMSAIIGRNLSTIRQIVKDTQMPEETAEKFFEVWNTFEPTSNFLNR
jgi:radical SAM superfamily enzyme YgiQ (UPF0313 family)